MAIDVEGYIEFVQNAVARFESAGKVIHDMEITPADVNKALAEFYTTALALNAEYQRAKITHRNMELDYQAWYDRKFRQARDKVVESYDTKKVKPSVTEYEVELRLENETAYREWQDKLSVADAKVQFLLRMRETLMKLDSILVTLSTNLRSEMRSLSIEDRAEAMARDANGLPKRTTGRRIVG